MKTGSIIFFFLLLSTGYNVVRAQSAYHFAKPNHDALIQKVRESENLSYGYCLKTFDDYLRMHPNDVNVWIEKCKFVDQAQYNESEEYNPNQEAYDELIDEVQTKFPDNVQVSFYLLESMWGASKAQLLEELKDKLDDENDWADSNKARVYYELAQVRYDSSEFKTAYEHLLDAIDLNERYEYDVLHAQILIELGKKKEALTVLTDTRDTSTEPAILYQKANLLMLIKQYRLAVATYDTLYHIDSNYTGNIELAKAMEAASYYSRARNYLLAESERAYNKERAQLALFLHDLKYQSSRLAMKSYNQYRKKGFTVIPLVFIALDFFSKIQCSPGTFAISRHYISFNFYSLFYC